MSADVSWIGAALDELRSVLTSKNQDYRIDGEFSNFEFAANIADIDVVDSITNQLAIKLGRIKGLGEEPNNEAKLDSYKDLAGYAILLYAYVLSEQEADKEQCAHVSFSESVFRPVTRAGLTEYLRKCDDCSKAWVVIR